MHSLSCFQLGLQILLNVVHIYLQELTVKQIIGLLASQIICNNATNLLVTGHSSWREILSTIASGTSGLYPSSASQF